MSEATARPVTVTAMSSAMQAIGGGLGWSLVPALMPQIAGELELSHAQSAMIWGAASLGIALASPAGGAAVDRYGARRVGAIAMAVGAIACAARAWAPDAMTLALTMLLFGAHVGFVAPAIPKALAGHVPATAIGRANGLALLGYTFGTALTVLLARTVLAPAFGGWRGATIAAAFAMVGMAALWFAVVRDRGTRSRHASMRDSIALLANGTLVRVACMHFLLFGGYLTLLGLLPRALGEAGLAPTQVGIAVAGWLFAAGIANFVGPVISDRLGRRRPLIVFGALLAATGIAILAFAPPEATIVWLAIAALGGGSFAPLLLAMPLEIRGVGVERAGAALGLLMLVGQLGGFVLPIVVGFIKDGPAGFGGAMLALALVHGAILIPALRLPETGPAAREDAVRAEARAVVA
ncbi:MAG: MFS transporter [Myxococcota bacterium]|nr:MFS transporter [Myxococcota bacterium]